MGGGEGRRARWAEGFHGAKAGRRAVDLNTRLSKIVRAAGCAATQAAPPARPDRDTGESNRSEGPGIAQSGLPRGREIRWSLGADWFIAVGALHTLLAVALGALLSPWWIAACGASLMLKTVRVRPGEAYLLIPFDDRLEVRRRGAALKLTGACWMTRRWLVIPTSRRVLPLRRGRLSAQDFARLRRAARG